MFFSLLMNESVVGSCCNNTESSPQRNQKNRVLIRVLYKVLQSVEIYIQHKSSNVMGPSGVSVCHNINVLFVQCVVVMQHPKIIMKINLEERRIGSEFVQSMFVLSSKHPAIHKGKRSVDRHRANICSVNGASTVDISEMQEGKQTNVTPEVACNGDQNTEGDLTDVVHICVLLVASVHSS